MGKTLVFLGPTLSHDEARVLCEATYYPPVSQGDIIRACKEKPQSIVIIDGVFNCVPSVWHKEILFALSEGISIVGAASMGALRAAELHPFGMLGVGEIYRRFRSGIYEDDDEVAIIHSDGDLGYRSMSDAMANIRATLELALAEGVVDESQCRALCNFAKSRFYASRSYADLLAHADLLLASEASKARFRAWIGRNKVDQKKLDAMEALRFIDDHRDCGHCGDACRFAFERTALFQECVRLAGASLFRNDGSMHHGDSFGRLRRAVGGREIDPALISRRLLLDEAARHGFVPSIESIAEEVIDWRSKRGLVTEHDLLQWMRDNDLTVSGFLQLIADELRIGWATRLVSEEALVLSIDHLRATGKYCVQSQADEYG